MERKKEYLHPNVLKQVRVQLENSLLVGSTIEELEIEATGQDVETLDFDSSGFFNHSWDE